MPENVENNGGRGSRGNHGRRRGRGSTPRRNSAAATQNHERLQQQNDTTGHVVAENSVQEGSGREARADETASTSVVARAVLAPAQPANSDGSTSHSNAPGSELVSPLALPVETESVSPGDFRIYPASHSSYSDDSKVDVDSLGREIGDVSGVTAWPVYT